MSRKEKIDFYIGKLMSRKLTAFMIGSVGLFTGQDLYNKLHDILWNYIQENYEEMEVSELKQSINNK